MINGTKGEIGGKWGEMGEIRFSNKTCMRYAQPDLVSAGRESFLAYSEILYCTIPFT